MASEIGKYTYSPTPVTVHYDDAAKLTVGKFCSFGHGVNIFLGGNHRADWLTTFPLGMIGDLLDMPGHPSSKGDVNIGNDVWLGMNVVVMSGITIGNGAVVGAFSVVTKDIGDYEIWAGNPARYKKDRFSIDTKNKLRSLLWWEWPEAKILAARDYLLSGNIDGLINFDFEYEAGL
jgi:virginiamycin A acetyltransferase